MKKIKKNREIRIEEIIVDMKALAKVKGTDKRQTVKDNQKTMNEVMASVRRMMGKETKGYHYANEARLLNWVMTPN